MGSKSQDCQGQGGAAGCLVTEMGVLVDLRVWHRPKLKLETGTRQSFRKKEDQGKFRAVDRKVVIIIKKVK